MYILYGEKQRRTMYIACFVVLFSLWNFDIKTEEFRFTMTVYTIHTKIYGIVFAFYALHYENIRISP